MSGLIEEHGVQRSPAGRLYVHEAPPPQPLLWPAIAFMGGIALSEYLGPLAGPPLWWPALLPPVLLVAALVARRRWPAHPALVPGLLLAAALAVGLLRHQAVVAVPDNHVSRLVSSDRTLTRLEAEVVTAPVVQPTPRRNPFIPFNPGAQSRFVVAARALRTTDPPTPLCGRMHVTVKNGRHTLQLGQRVVLTGWLHGARGPRNPGEPDWARWQRLQGIAAGLTVEGPEHVQPVAFSTAAHRRLVAALRNAARVLLLEPYAEWGSEAGGRLLETMVLGQRGAADREINEAFLRAGGLHFLAVSGFHVGVLAGMAWWLARRLTRRPGPAALVVLAVILVYAVVAEPRAPVLRATVAGVLVALALLSRRPTSGLNVLACAALFILALEPRELFRPGFQLSFVQVFGLLTVVPLVRRALTRRPTPGTPAPEAHTYARLALWRVRRGLLWLAVVCVVAWAWSLPLVALHFQRVSAWGWVGTFLLSVPVMLAIWFSFATVLAGLAFPPAAPLLAALTAGLTDLLFWIVRWFERLPGALLELSAPPGWLVLLFYAACLVVLTHQRATAQAARRYRHAALAVAWTQRRRVRQWLLRGLAGGLYGACLAWALLPIGRPAARCALHVLAVGNGSTMLLETPAGQAACLDIGTDRNLDAGVLAARALRALGLRKLEAVAVSHADFDHYSGLPTLLEHVRVGRIWTSPYFGTTDDASPALRQLLTLLPAGRVPDQLTAGDWVALGTVRIEVLWPPAGLDPLAWRPNDRSLVLRLHYGGRTVLLPGDIEAAAIRALLARQADGQVQLAADVLVAPHHGSFLARDTAALLAAVNPEIIIVSAAEARPKFTAAVAQTLGPGCPVLNTAERGAVSVVLGQDGTLRLETPFAQPALP
jgi:competence protein ComEC